MTVRITLRETAEGRRRCGSCTLCCRLLPVRTLEKPANTRCQHQRHGKGCRIYADLQLRVPECHTWTCRWLTQGDTLPGVPRPDHAHFVIDVVPDFVTVQDNETGASHDILALQVWVDPAHRDAHRHPALRAYIEKLCEEQPTVAICRFNERDAVTLIPPALNSSGKWAEMSQGQVVENTPERMARLWGGDMDVVMTV